MTDDEIIDHRQWHEKRLVECGYPTKIVEKLRIDREYWYGTLKKKNRS